MFRFKEMWLREDSCKDIIRENWVQGMDLSQNLATTASSLRACERERLLDLLQSRSETAKI